MENLSARQTVATRPYSPPSLGPANEAEVKYNCTSVSIAVSVVTGVV